MAGPMSLLGLFAFAATAHATSPTPVEKIDAAIAEHWEAYGLSPAPEEQDGKWCRRVFLDLIGRIPTFDELQDFLRDRDADKREKLVNRLLEDSQYTEEYAGHWASIWSNILIGRSGGQDRRSLISREGMDKYLRDCFADNKTYDRMVYELITATGTTKPGSEGFNGATNFLIDKVNAENGTQATSATARLFLGLQVQCTQCHNHPFNDWKQQKFWEFNAFFRQTVALRRFVSGTRNIDYAELVDQDFAGKGGGASEAEIYFQERNEISRVAYPVFVDGTAIGRSGYVSDVNRRTELGKLIVGSEYLSMMLVNRMWAHFLGYAFTKPMDDFGPHTPVSHPALLSDLSEDFRQSSYDLKKLMKWITLSRPYQLSSQTNKRNVADDPSLGESPKFSHFYLRQMSAEQLYQSLLKVGGQATGSLQQQQRQRDAWLSQFVVAFGTDEGDEATTFNGSIPQALMLFNGDLVKRATSVKPDAWLGRLVQAPISTQEKIHVLFQAGVARRATQTELKAANQLLSASNGKPEEALQDLWWAILNSNEFILVQ
ncbi:MAG: DUF1549 domain-containing protein [Planctomycetales bacterium]|nr:DUF1549 domain-containing protein [Planctomycetales bacterium]